MLDLLRDAARTFVPERGDPHGPLPPLLLVLTVVTGLVDAVSYLRLGHVFVANMTGNVVFLGFAIAGAGDVSLVASLVALLAFMAGALLVARLGAAAERHRGRRLLIALVIKSVLVVASVVVAVRVGEQFIDSVRIALIVLLGLAMGVQNATVRKLAVPDLTTTVLTLTLTGLVADSPLGGGSYPHPGRRLAAVASMLVGASIGGLLVLRLGVVAALGVAIALLASAGIATWRLCAAPAPWTEAPGVNTRSENRCNGVGPV